MTERSLPFRTAVVDFGMGNLHSIHKALERLGFSPAITCDPAEIAAAPAVVLPGDGAFGDAITEMTRLGILDCLRERANEAAEGGRPFLGICIGMQVLVETSEENPGVQGLSVLKGTCPRIEASAERKVPQMGWNKLDVHEECALFDGLGPQPYVYFVHSFHVEPNDRQVVAATTHYGSDLVAVLHRGNLFATQFHPEKSQKIGLRMLQNFGALVAANQ